MYPYLYYIFCCQLLVINSSNVVELTLLRVVSALASPGALQTVVLLSFFVVLCLVLSIFLREGRNKYSSALDLLPYLFWFHLHRQPIVPLPPKSCYCWARCRTVWNIPSVIWGCLSWLCPLVHPQPPCRQGEKQKTPRVREHCSGPTKPSMCCQHRFRHKSKT